MSDFEVHDPRFGGFFMGNAALEKLAGGFRWAEGPVWFGDAGFLLFSDIPNNRIMRWSDGAGRQRLSPAPNYTNGHTRDREGRLVAASTAAGASAAPRSTAAITVLVDRWQGKPLNSPNDVVVKSDGTIWFTDPHYGIMTDYEGDKAEQEIAPATSTASTRGRRARAWSATTSPAQRALLLARRAPLYVAETGMPTPPTAPRHIRVFDVVDGVRLSGGEVF